MCGHGPEGWHPNPSFFYNIGGGPMLDMGPYYVTALVNILGPVKRVAAITTKGFEERIATSQALHGLRIPVEYHDAPHRLHSNFRTVQSLR